MRFSVLAGVFALIRVELDGLAYVLFRKALLSLANDFRGKLATQVLAKGRRFLRRPDRRALLVRKRNSRPLMVFVLTPPNIGDYLPKVYLANDFFPGPSKIEHCCCGIYGRMATLSTPSRREPNKS
jgi:hypothetical protein